MKRFKRMNWKGIISTVLAVILAVGAIAGVAAIFGIKTKTISPTVFAVGSVDNNGNYESSDKSIYTKDVFECQGLTIEPKFETSGTYQVFYYDAEKKFIDSTDIINSTDGVYVKEHTYPNAKYCRIVITPSVPVDEFGVEEENFKISFYEVYSFASDYSIKVDKDQTMTLPDLFKLGEHCENTDIRMDSTSFNEVELEGKAYLKVCVEGYEKLTMGSVNGSSLENVTIVFTNGSELNDSSDVLYSGTGARNVNVPANAEFLYVLYNMGDKYIIK